jgi:hypothetical protein
VGPGTELVRWRQRAVRVVHRDERQRPVRARALVELGVLVVRVTATREHDQREPGREAGGARVRDGRAVPPGEVLVVELDVGEEVGFGVGDPAAWLDAGDRARVDADDVTRPVHLDGLLDVVGERAAVAGDAQAHLDARPVRGTGRCRDARGEPGAQPGQEGVRILAHGATSQAP